MILLSSAPGAHALVYELKTAPGHSCSCHQSIRCGDARGRREERFSRRRRTKKRIEPIHWHLKR